MQTLFLLASLFSFMSAAEVGYVDPAKKIGISFAELERLGNKADKELLRRFSDTPNIEMREGILQRMRLFGNLKRPNREMHKVLVRFVEEEVSACKGQVDVGRIWTVGLALEVIGQRTGKPGEKYLTNWVSNDEARGRINCFAANTDAASTQARLQLNALTGLGLSGSKSAQKYLTQLSLEPQSSKRTDAFIKILNNAIALNAKIQVAGAKAYWENAKQRVKKGEE